MERLVRTTYHPLIMASILLLIAGSRILRLNGLELDIDEIWTIWQTFGSPREIIAWTPYDWPPLHYLLLGGWKELAGIHPVAARYFSVLILLPGIALVYRVFRRDAGQSAGLLAMLAYAAMSYMMILSVLVRGYIIVASLLPLALWLAQRYFHRPTVIRGVLLGATMATMFYTHLTSVLAFAALGLYTLVVFPRQVWRWWLPGLTAALLALPLVAAKLGTAVSSSRLEITSQMVLPPLHEGLADLFSLATGALAPVWLALVVVATGAMLVRGQMRRPRVLVWLLWTVGGAIALYLTNPLFGFFSLRYGWWMMLGFAAWVAVGASFLARWGQVAVAAVLIVSLFYPLSEDDMHSGVPTPPMQMLFNWLHEQIQWGDVVVVDPSVEATPEAWDYYTQVYFPNGLRFVSDPAGYRRVWYVTADGWEDEMLSAAVRENRVAGPFVGPWQFLTRLYEGPPDTEGVLFENGMRFHGAEILQPDAPHEPMIALREGERVTLRLWWAVDRQVELDYSISLRLTTPNGATLIQMDSAPQVPNEPSETSRWQLDRFYIEERTLRLPDQLVTGTYDLSLIVYQWWDNVRVPFAGTEGDPVLPIGSISVKAW